MADPTFQDYLTRLFKIESGGNPNAVTGSNRGLGQFGPNEERMYGITNANRTDPMVQAAAVAAEHAKNNAILQRALGRDPTFADHYLAHQQGVTGASQLLANPDQPAWKTIRPYYKSDAIAQSAIMGNIPSDNPLKRLDVNQISGKGFTDMWADKFNRGLPGGAGGSGAPPVQTAAVPAFGAGAAPAIDASGVAPQGQLSDIMASLPPSAGKLVASMPAPAPGGGGGAAPIDDAANQAKVAQLLKDRESGEQSPASKQMMALAQQLLAQGAQKPDFKPMQLAPANTGPVRPLPLSLPQFGQLS